jgi:hypothetical protein
MFEPVSSLPASLRKPMQLFDPRSRRSVNRLILILRLIATIVALILAVVLWKVMAALSWEAVGGLAIVAALVWAYAFERNTT